MRGRACATGDHEGSWKLDEHKGHGLVSEGAAAAPLRRAERGITRQYERLCAWYREMGFKARPNSYYVDLAPTGRARCMRCRTLIPKGSVRIVTRAFIRPQRFTYFARCAPSCIDVAFAAAVIRQHRRADDVPVAADVSLEAVDSIKSALHGHWAACSASESTALPSAHTSASRQTSLPEMLAKVKPGVGA